ncbi:MAG: efflux RND transporter periplasmic adaptor subunit [Holophagales bacterium]|jgi:cobalt-zinc-cadmium efflux system membrane fusion protein|nr:efflux RND transporter periplasmic adaptor subunit [Holophagales bacterium]
MNKFNSIALLSVLTVCVSTSCHRKASADGHEDHDHGHAVEEVTGHEGHDHSQMIPLTNVPGIRTQVADVPKSLSVWIPAEVMADESSQFVLTSPLNGILGALKVTPGRLVEASTALAEINSPELARMYADWLAAKAKLMKAESALAREERLDSKKATSQRDLEEAISEASIARAEERSARMALEACGMAAEEDTAGSKWVLKAPRAGTVINYKAISGQGISAGQELGYFLAAGPVIVRMELAPAHIGNWELGHTFTVKHSGGRQWDGKLEGALPALSPDTMRQSYRLRLTGSSLPLPGTPVEVQIPYPPSITLPQAALQRLEGLWGVYIVENGHAEFRPVARGQDIKGEVIILDGIKSGETVVVEGAYLLKAYQQKLAHPDEEEGHVH